MNEAAISRAADFSFIAMACIVGSVCQVPMLKQCRMHPGLQCRLPKEARVNVTIGLRYGWAFEGAVGNEFKIDASCQFERLLTELASKHVREEQSLTTSLDEQLGSVVDLQAGQAKALTHVDRVEQLFGGCSERHAKEIRALKDAQEHQASEGTAAIEALLRSLEVRVERCLDKAAQDVQSVRASRGQHEEDLAASREAQRGRTEGLGQLRAAAARHAALPERLERLEAVLSDSADRHSRDLDALSCLLADSEAHEGEALRQSKGHVNALSQRLDF